MRNVLFLIGIALPLSLCSQQVEKHISYGNENIGFWEYKPASYNSDQTTKYPLIIFLHGIGERGNGTSELWKVKRIGIPSYIENGETMRFNKDGKSYSFIVLSPQCSTKYGMWPTLYVDGLIEYAEKNLRIDRSRIYLTGLSMGGGGTWKYASASLANAKKLAAIATVCAPATLTDGCNIAKAQLPMWSFQATDDDVVNPSIITTAINKVLACNPAIKPIKTIWTSGGHYIWDRAYDTRHTYQTPNVFEWFLGYTRGGSEAQPMPVPDNKPPVAKAGGNRTIGSSDAGSVRLNGTLSTDPDGWIQSFEWLWIKGPEKTQITNSTGGQAFARNLKAGTYTYRLVVTDNLGGQSYDDVVITVKDDGGKSASAASPGNAQKGNQAPVARAGADMVINLPQNFARLNATTSYDRDDYISTFRWTKVSGPSAFRIANANAGNTQVADLAEGTYRFRVTVRDGKGASSSDDVVIRVNRPPVMKLGPDKTLTLPVNGVLLNGTLSTDPGGWIQKFRWTKMRGPNTFSIHTPTKGSTIVHGLVEGTYTFRLTATDGDGASSYAEVKVYVKRPSVSQQARAVVEERASEPDSGSSGPAYREKILGILSVYPNPAKAMVNITCNTPGTGKTGVTIFDIAGRPVRTMVFDKNQPVMSRSINIADLKKGAYVITVSVNNARVASQQFIKE